MNIHQLIQELREPAETKIVLLVAEVYLARSYREAFAPMLHAQNAPHTSPPASGRTGVTATVS